MNHDPDQHRGTAAAAHPDAPSLPSRPQRPARNLRKATSELAMKATVLLLVAIIVLPMLWLVSSSFKTQAEFVSSSVWAPPESFNFQNYVDAWTTGNISVNVRNSILVTIPSLFLILSFGVAAGYVLEVMVWRGRATTLLIFVAGIMIPGQMVLAPLFIVYFRTGLTNTLWPLILTYTALGLPLTVFMMAAYFRSVPRELFEAATIDGAGMIRSFFSIGLPMIKNAVFTIALVQFFFVWNDLLIALTFVTDRNLETIQVGLLNFSGEFGSLQYGPLFAGICINVFGTFVIYLFLNKRLMRGMASGALKG